MTNMNGAPEAKGKGEQNPTEVKTTRTTAEDMKGLDNKYAVNTQENKRAMSEQQKEFFKNLKWGDNPNLDLPDMGSRLQKIRDNIENGDKRPELKRLYDMLYQAEEVDYSAGSNNTILIKDRPKENGGAMYYKVPYNHLVVKLNDNGEIHEILFYRQTLIEEDSLHKMRFEDIQSISEQVLPKETMIFLQKEIQNLIARKKKKWN